VKPWRKVSPVGAVVRYDDPVAFIEEVPYAS
jgi:hypothetical protein